MFLVRLRLMVTVIRSDVRHCGLIITMIARSVRIYTGVISLVVMHSLWNTLALNEPRCTRCG